MPEPGGANHLSIGEVLGLLLEDFPDVTISKIRFLESQGLIEPERTPSGYRKFYDHDVELLRTILHEQKANFLPLKVIRDRIESGALESENGPTRTPPRGIRNVEPPPAEARDSVFRRTDGGPEWADGHALIPGEDPTVVGQPPITTAVQVTPAAPLTAQPAETVAPEMEVAPATAAPVETRKDETPVGELDVAPAGAIAAVESSSEVIELPAVQAPPAAKTKPSAGESSSKSRETATK